MLPMEDRYAVALNDQGRFAPTVVGDFAFVPEAGRHIWNGKVATSMAELAEQVNGAIKSIVNFGDPFKTIEVVPVGKQTAAEGVTASHVDLMGEANGMLLDVVAQTGGKAPGKLKVLATE
jgi:hypothetical protein